MLMNTVSPLSSNQLTFVFLNIQSLRNKMHELQIMAKTNTPDVIVLNEIWIKTS